jgi:hypothetical protein
MRTRRHCSRGGAGSAPGRARRSSRARTGGLAHAIGEIGKDVRERAINAGHRRFGSRALRVAQHDALELGGVREQLVVLLHPQVELRKVAQREVRAQPLHRSGHLLEEHVPGRLQREDQRDALGVRLLAMDLAEEGVAGVPDRLEAVAEQLAEPGRLHGERAQVVEEPAVVARVLAAVVLGPAPQGAPRMRSTFSRSTSWNTMGHHDSSRAIRASGAAERLAATSSNSQCLRSSSWRAAMTIFSLRIRIPPRDDRVD